MHSAPMIIVSDMHEAAGMVSRNDWMHASAAPRGAFVTAMHLTPFRFATSKPSANPGIIGGPYLEGGKKGGRV